MKILLSDFTLFFFACLYFLSSVKRVKANLNSASGSALVDEEWPGSETKEISYEDFHDSQISRSGKFLDWPPFFRSVGIGNSNISCTFNSTQGVCKSRKCCDKEGGSVLGEGSCGRFGVCCLVRARCPAGQHTTTVINSGTHVQHPPGYLIPYDCRFDIPRPDGICQIRLDFLSFNMYGPSNSAENAGDCNTDSMTITGAENLKQFSICGVNDGQHLYLHYGDSTKISLSMHLETLNRNFDILVTYIKCPNYKSNLKGKRGQSQNQYRSYGSFGQIDFTMKSPLKRFKSSQTSSQETQVQVEAAPPGCSQYFTSPSGTVRSFNYVTVSNVTENEEQFQINNEQYAVCVKNVQDSTEINWKTCAGGAFTISGVLPTTDLSFKPISGCQTDFIDIPGSKDGRYCGLEFPALVKSTAQPYAIYVNFDQRELLGVGDEDFNPETGCCFMCTCVDSIGRPVDPVDYPCGKDPAHKCQPSAYLTERSDMNNIGFCLDYTIN